MSLIFANVVTIMLAILGNWDLTTVLFIYWSQSVIIGLFAVISMLGADTVTLAGDLDKPLKDLGRTREMQHPPYLALQEKSCRVLCTPLRALSLGVFYVYCGVRYVWAGQFLRSRHLAFLWFLFF